MEGVSHRNSVHRRLRFSTVHFVPARHQQTDATNKLIIRNQKHLRQKPTSSCGRVGDSSAVSPVRNIRRINDLNMAKVPIFEDLSEQQVLVQRSSMVLDQLLIQLCSVRRFCAMRFYSSLGVRLGQATMSGWSSTEYMVLGPEYWVLSSECCVLNQLFIGIFGGTKHFRPLFPGELLVAFPDFFAKVALLAHVLDAGTGLDHRHNEGDRLLANASAEFE